MPGRKRPGCVVRAGRFLDDNQSDRRPTNVADGAVRVVFAPVTPCTSLGNCVPQGARARRNISIGAGGYLRLIAHGVADDERFAAEFRLAWLQLPPGVRKTLLGYWHRWPEPPVIGCLPDAAMWRPERGRHEVAVTGCEGHRLHFWASAAGAMPRGVLRAAIAHELAHVFMFAEDGPDALQSESDADTLVWKWGFDIGGTRRWLRRWRAERQTTVTP